MSSEVCNKFSEEANDEIVEESNMLTERSNNVDSEHNFEGEHFRKLFLGGLHYNSTEESVKSHFGRWGEIVDCVVMRDPQTKRSRGFGFLTYSKAHMVDAAQAARPHRIDGREVETKRAVPRENSGKPESQITVKTLYVARLKDDVEDRDLRDHFGKYGRITSVNMVCDKATGKKRGFAFIEFDDYDPVDKVVLSQQYVKGNQVQVKKALPKQGAGNKEREPPVDGRQNGVRGRSGIPNRGVYPPRGSFGGHAGRGGYGGPNRGTHDGVPYGAQNTVGYYNAPSSVPNGGDYVSPAAWGNGNNGYGTPASSDTYYTPPQDSGYGAPSAQGSNFGNATGNYSGPPRPRPAYNGPSRGSYDGSSAQSGDFSSANYQSGNWGSDNSFSNAGGPMRNGRQPQRGQGPYRRGGPGGNRAEYWK